MQHEYRLAPFRQIVLKVHSRCDLACDHCYMYEAADQGWRFQPKTMTRATAEAAGHRIAEHADTHGLELVRVILHGGEPLMARVEQLREIIQAVREPLSNVTPHPPRLDLRIHTNAVTLDERFLELFKEYDVKVGVSLDGDKIANDRHRLYASGRSSHQQVLAGLALLRSPRYRHLYAGILCTVDIANDPVAVYRALVAEKPPRIDLLLPHATWDTPPPRVGPRDHAVPPAAVRDSAYADWLLRVYELWREDGRPFGIRLFDSIRSTLHGDPPLTEALGLAPSDVLTIQTDGSIEQVDSLRIAFDGAAGTGLSVFEHPLDAARDNAQIIARQSGADSLSDQCRSCPVLTSCGGGLFAHRYRSAAEDEKDPAAAFRNPTVYCSDLYILINSIENAEKTGMPPHRPLSLAGDRFDRLASGFGDAADIRALTETQASINRALLASAGVAMANQTSEAAHAWELLLALDESRPGAVAEAVTHPFFRPWALDAISDPLSAHPAVLVGYALAAASAAGRGARLPVPRETSHVLLPSLGRIPTVDSWASLDASGSVAEFTVEARHVDLGPDGPRILLEDLDDARAGFHLPPTPRLSEGEFKQWQSRLAEAWRIIAHEYPDYAGALAAGLSCIVPLSPSPDGHATSGTARQAYGTLGIALPPDPQTLALLVIHEYQHVKLGALLDLFDLYDKADTRLYYAPWRPDPRPLEGLLQGTYAHVAVVDFWRRRTDATAEIHFARWREQTWEALGILEDSGSLTDVGSQLTERLRATMRPWLSVNLTEEALAEARRSSDDHQNAFRHIVRAEQ